MDPVYIFLWPQNFRPHPLMKNTPCERGGGEAGELFHPDLLDPPRVPLCWTNYAPPNQNSWIHHWNWMKFEPAQGNLSGVCLECSYERLPLSSQSLIDLTLAPGCHHDFSVTNTMPKRTLKFIPTKSKTCVGMSSDFSWFICNPEWAQSRSSNLDL